MPAKIVILQSSPRAQSNSSRLARELATGAQSLGAQVRSFDLARMRIHPCDACDECKQTGVCVLADDMQQIYPALEQADAVVLATPIYWFTYSAQLKLCIDRWYALEATEGGRLHGKRFALLVAYADSDPYSSGAVNAFHTFRDMVRYLHGEVAGIIYGSADAAGDIERQPELLQAAFALGKKLASEPQ